jgi:hypothetical protein
MHRPKTLTILIVCATVLVLVNRPLVNAQTQAASDSTCKDVGTLSACYSFSRNGSFPVVQISVKTIELQNEYLPVTGYWIDGRVSLSDGSFYDIRTHMNRLSWEGYNSVSIMMPAGVVPVGMSVLVVIPRRDDRSVPFIQPTN